MTKHIFWLASYPKSGNTLLRAILSSLFFTENGVFNFKLLESITNFDIECLTKDIATCGIYEDFKKPIEHEDGYLIFQPDDFFQNINLQDSDGNSVTVSGYAECLHYLNGGYAKAEIVSAENRTPKVNRIFLFLIIISFIYLVFNNKSYLINR